MFCFYVSQQEIPSLNKGQMEAQLAKCGLGHCNSITDITSMEKTMEPYECCCFTYKNCEHGVESDVMFMSFCFVCPQQCAFVHLSAKTQCLDNLS